MSGKIVGWIRTTEGTEMIHEEELAVSVSRHPSSYGRELSLPPLRVVKE